MTKVKCRVCSNEDNGCCTVNKNKKVKLNKSRNCKNFVFAMEKVRVKQKLSATMRPDWYWNRKEAIQAYRKSMLAKAAQSQVAATPQYLDNSSLEKPDCLSNFRSTAGKTPEENNDN